jgi:hypothetical protein
VHDGACASRCLHYTHAHQTRFCADTHASLQRTKHQSARVHARTRKRPDVYILAHIRTPGVTPAMRSSRKTLNRAPVRTSIQKYARQHSTERQQISSTTKACVYVWCCVARQHMRLPVQLSTRSHPNATQQFCADTPASFRDKEVTLSARTCTCKQPECPAAQHSRDSAKNMTAVCTNTRTHTHARV